MSAPAVRIGTLSPEGWQASYPIPDEVGAAARRDQMFLRQALRAHRRSIAVAEREAFDARADRILAQLDPRPSAPEPAPAPVTQLRPSAAAGVLDAVAAA